MFRAIASRMTTVTTTGIPFRRNASAICGPPTKHISTVEKYTLATIMVVCWNAVPVYIMSNLKHYKANKSK